ncbi:MAG: hypothetical protein ACD_61C00049G0002 [uncultured bacterium]|uniref:Uncharacterized protein n=1 Tax=Candidatus Collierbacteria bacterium GW2011_GWC2_44_18 TaxID=1618392 RepID=A0A0G1HP05_9BACT|nr:MAG: hypothetical protein ACD_61C00049G0002 [uncultured bacterium]KKT48620.1 MAG: hypothetical protein UW41_C0023G0014 [Candidatus Collierbacteria bacterium GW2011_GWC2_44_18]
MAQKENGKLLRTVNVYPPDRTNIERIKDYRSHHETGQRLEIDNRGKLVVTQEVADMVPKQIIVLSDWHLGSKVSDLEAMDELLSYVLSNPDVLVIFAGDEIEGWSSGKHSQSIDSKADADAQTQLEFMRMMYFEPLANAGRILGMVSEYWAHPGWMAENTMNTWRAMIGDLDIKLIQNGGTLILKFPNGYEHDIKVWHNPPKGSKFDELDGQRIVMQNTSESSRPKGSVAGHIHRMQVAEEVYAGAKYKVYYISAGTVKGTNQSGPTDLFGTQLGLSRPEPQGQVVTIIPKKGRREDMNIPSANLRQAQTAIDAVTLLDRVEQLGNRKELLELIHDEDKGVETGPIISYPTGSNRLGVRYAEDRPIGKIMVGGETVKNPYSKIEMKAPYSTLNLDIRTSLPVALELVANARIGSTLEGFKDLQGFMREVAENPHRLVLFLRNMIDKEAGRLPHRIDVLDKFVQLIGREGERTNYQTLAIMMCESMRQNAWKGKVGKDERQLPIAPGSYVATATGIPLIHHLSLLKLSIGPVDGRKTIYPVVTADKAEGHGSGSKPEWALQRLYDLHIHEKPGLVVGTHMANAGAATFYDGSNAFTKYPMLVAPGWWAKAVDSIGKGNVKPGAEPGQAVIFMPGKTQEEYLAFPTVSREETEYKHDALMLLKGLEILGLKEKVLGKKK